MKKINKLIAGLTAGILTACMTSSLAVFPEEDQILRVMPLGDSITDGFTGDPVGGYRLTLWKMLEENGYTDHLDFVGPQWGGDGIDPNHAGYSGYAIADIPGQRSGIYNFSEWLMESYPADVVMLQIGTNDILSSALDGMDERLELLVDTILNYIPEDGLLFVSTIPYMDADVTNYTDAYTVEEMDKAVDDYNTQIREIVSRKQSEGKPIAQADIHSVLTKADLLDGVHPNSTGYQKMGAYWYEQLTNYIDGNVELPSEVPAESETDPPTEEITEPDTEPSTEEITEPDTEPSTEEIIEPDTELSTEEITEPDTEEPTEPETEPITTGDNFWTDVRLEAGDLNIDWKVDILDIIQMQKYLLGKSDYLLSPHDGYHIIMTDDKPGDLNRDDIVNIYDLILLKRKVLGNYGI